MTERRWTYVLIVVCLIIVLALAVGIATAHPVIPTVPNPPGG